MPFIGVQKKILKYVWITNQKNELKEVVKNFNII